uniref:Programmed cell death protein 2 C-terminal domain-containing protein n=1 Tax=Clastoptera arizonana TaxID=38151 RepID=A0A1B6CVA3_9HEMI
MAKKNDKVLLGYEDEVITEKHKSFVDFTTNKIGGKPDFYTENTKLPICHLCRLSLPLLAQIYAPLENSGYHRTLYIFACINPNCWNSHESWVCLRSQLLDTSSTDLVKTETTLNTSDWCDGADNWEDEENGNTIESILNRQQQSSDDDMSCSMAQLAFDERNANSGAGCLAGGATGKLLSPTATAEIEGDESEMITIDTPTSSQFDLLALLESAVPVPQVPSVSIEFISFFISVGEEEHPVTNSPTNAEHVRELLQEYRVWSVDEESNAVPVCNQIDEAVCQSSESGEKYERTMPAHGDKMFHNFVSKIQNNPGQILRYIRDAGSPLFLYPALNIPRSCRHCKGNLVPEIQILPTIIPCLKLHDGTAGHLEFGSVYIYTCKKSCWTPGDSSKEEFVYVQCEKITRRPFATPRF